VELMIGLLIGMGILILCAEDETLEELAERRAIREGAVPDEERFSLVPMPGDEELKSLGIVWSNGKFYRALRGKAGLLYIDQGLLKPGENKEGDFAFYLRMKKDFTPMVACYGDMMVSAIVMPMKGTGIMEDLRMIAETPLHVFWREEDGENGA